VEPLLDVGVALEKRFEEQATRKSLQ